MDQKKILLVEDDPVLQKLYKDLLTAEKYSVDTASDGQEAYEKMLSGGWDLVLLDLVLPKLNGLDIVKKLKLQPSKKTNKKIVVLTNLEKGNEVDEIKRIGYEYIIKSNITPDQFVAKIKSFL